MKDDDTEKPAFFVSRRGRQVGMHEVDLKGIDIESNETSPSTSSRVRKDSIAVSQKAERSRKPRPGLTKTKTIALGVVLLVLSVPLIGAELVTAQYRNGVTSAKQDLAELVSTTVLPTQKKSAISASQLHSLATEVNGIVGRMCRGGLLDNAAGLYPRANSALTDCKTAQRSYTSLAHSLYALEAQSRYLEQVDGIIKPAATPITDEYAVIGSQQTTWQKVDEGLKKISPPESMKSAHNQLAVHVHGVAEAWSKLNTANNAHDAVGFEAAEKTLTIEYEAVRASSPAFLEVLAGTQASILKNYSALK